MSVRWRRVKVWWRKTARPFWRDVQWIAIGLAAALALVLGVWGFERYLDDREGSHSVGETVYRSLALFGFEGGATPPLPWQLDVARVLAPLTAVYAAVSTAATLLRDQLELMRLRLVSEHVLVCGLGARGLLLAKSFNALGERVVAIEVDENAPGIGECREEGISVLIGDATDRTVLTKARAHAAKYVIAVGRDDAVNAEVAADVSQLASPDRRRALTAFVHVTDPKLCALLRERTIAAADGGSARLEFFSVYEIAARALVSEYLALHGDAASDRPVHVVVVGLGQLGEAITVHAARAWHAVRREGGRRLAVTVVDRDANRKCEALGQRYPHLRHVCDLAEKQMDIEDPDFRRAGFLAHEGQDILPSVVYVCVDDDSLGLGAAQALLPRVREHRIPVVVRLKQRAGLATLLGEDPGAGGGVDGLRAFPLLDRTCDPGMLLEGTREQLARLIHAGFLRRQRELGEKAETKPSVVEWERLDEAYRESSRRQADHVGVKLAEARCGLEPLTDWDADVAELDADEVEELAEMEHERWMAALVRDGWRRGDGVSDPDRKLNPHLVPWDELDDTVREWDRDAVRNLPSFLAEAGFRVYRLPDRGDARER